MAKERILLFMSGEPAYFLKKQTGAYVFIHQYLIRQASFGLHYSKLPAVRMVDKSNFDIHSRLMDPYLITTIFSVNESSPEVTCRV